MMEQTLHLDSIFGSLADPTRRDILRRVSEQELSVTEIAAPYSLTLAAISKHLKILEQAKLIIKNRRGKQQLVRAAPLYEQLWNQRFDRLEQLIDSVE
jgi:DNA-binding transcriptional ArsR family regulator